MNLSSPITITPPAITRSTGEVRIQKPITLNELDITLMDNAKQRYASVQIRPCPRPLTLWAGDAYDAAGDYTQAMVESKVLELLGNDPKAVLEGLFLPSARPTL